MPWTPKQHRLFEFAGHNPEKAKSEGIKIPQKTALKMASEGIKKERKGSAIRHLGVRRDK
jgi:hypothetical protein